VVHATTCCKSVEEDVLAANEAFYEVFASQDFEAMDELWADQHPVACVHPGWPALRTRDEVMLSWRGILTAQSAPPIRFTDPMVVATRAMAVVICTELLLGAEITATNVFVHEPPAWKICHHHAAPIARQVIVTPPSPDELN